MKVVVLMTALFLGVGNLLNAQVTTGSISGKVFEKDSATAMPFAKVYVESQGTKSFVLADENGRYKIDGLTPGVYFVGASFSGQKQARYSNVPVSPEGMTFLDLVMPQDSMLDEVVIWEYKIPLIDINIPKLTISTEDIEHSPYIRNPLTMLTSVSSDVKMMEGTGQILIRGSRPGDAVYYIDGVKQTDMGAVPGVAIGSMEAYTGGIPAKYGDTTGGVVILETKSYFDLYNAWLAGQ